MVDSLHHWNTPTILLMPAWQFKSQNPLNWSNFSNKPAQNMVLNQSSKERKWGLYSLINQMAYYIGGLNILQMNVRMGQ